MLSLTIPITGMTCGGCISSVRNTLLRRLVDEADALPLADRVTLFKGRIPGRAG